MLCFVHGPVSGSALDDTSRPLARYADYGPSNVGPYHLVSGDGSRFLGAAGVVDGSYFLGAAGVVDAVDGCRFLGAAGVVDAVDGSRFPGGALRDTAEVVERAAAEDDIEILATDDVFDVVCDDVPVGVLGSFDTLVDDSVLGYIPAG